MKKYFLSARCPLSLTLLFPLLMGCGSDRSTKQTDKTDTGSQTETTDSSTTPSADRAAGQNLACENRPCQEDFYQVTLVGSPNVVFTQGPRRIVVEAPAAALPSVVTDIDSKSLTINMTGENHYELQAFGSASNPVTVYVSSPEILYVAVCGSGDFRATGKVVSGDMQVGLLGSGQLSADSIDCHSLMVQHTGSGKANLTYAHCMEADVALFGSGSLSGTLNVSSGLTIRNEGSGTTDMCCQADWVSVSSTGSGNTTLDIDCQRVNINTSGNGTLTLEGHAGEKQTKRNGYATINDHLKMRR